MYILPCDNVPELAGRGLEGHVVMGYEETQLAEWEPAALTLKRAVTEVSQLTLPEDNPVIAIEGRGGNRLTMTRNQLMDRDVWHLERELTKRHS
jgi:hypothetical protein